jgi:hypothetical protein
MGLYRIGLISETTVGLRRTKYSNKINVRAL